jgi:hypothetical protein
VADEAAVFVEYKPAGHSCDVNRILLPDVEKVPRTELVQPSNAEVAAVRVDYWPAGHS